MNKDILNKILIALVTTEDFKTAKEVLKQGAEIDAIMSTPNLRQVKFVLENGINPDKDFYNYDWENTTAFKLFIDHGASYHKNINIENDLFDAINFPKDFKKYINALTYVRKHREKVYKICEKTLPTHFFPLLDIICNYNYDCDVSNNEIRFIINNFCDEINNTRDIIEKLQIYHKMFTYCSIHYIQICDMNKIYVIHDDTGKTNKLYSAIVNKIDECILRDKSFERYKIKFNEKNYKLLF